MSVSRKKQKAFLSLFLIAQLFFANSPIVFGAKVPSVASIAAQLEQRYHLNLGAIQNQGEGFNVSDNKKITPEVSIFFSPNDPKEGQKISAKAFPTYFSNNESSLYYTWYLKRADCSRNDCDYNNDNDYDEEDWKIEATRLLAQNGYDGTVNSPSGTDDDGYRARYGGENKVNTPNRCYVHDSSSGVNYELAELTVDYSFGCPAGMSPVCMVTEDDITSGANNGGENFFNVTSSSTCQVSGLPSCLSGVPTCGTGTPRCVTDPSTATTCESALSTCTSDTTTSANPYCRHVFPSATSGTSGDGSFGSGEEEFWGTDPSDPDTADNGNKDEANVVGLGQATFTWNYVSGDKVGVVVEGTSMVPTKHEDSSYMIMWAFSKNDCPISYASRAGAYTKSIRGYNVVIPAADMDINKCLERNLVDPAEGGQATNLDVTVTATPDNPVNDITDDKAGDLVIARAGVSNAGRNLTDVLFDWKVEISRDVRFSSPVDITADLRSRGLIGNTRGNALDSIRMKLDMPQSMVANYLTNGIGYLRFKATATENFSGGILRRGRSDVIVKFTSTDKKISAYKAGTLLDGGVMKASLSGAPIICNADALDRTMCRIVKNEIIGLRVDPNGLSNFHWTINGKPLTCSYGKVSTDCTDGEQNEANFFPATGNPGDTYTIVMTANDVTTGSVVTLSRTFHIVEPGVTIASADTNAAWPKLLGQYRDITGQATGCPNGLCDDYSTSVFEAFSGSALGFRATFIPSFLANTAEREWYVDGSMVAESGAGQISFTADKLPGEIYNVSLAARVTQSDDTRRALLDIWGISPFDSSETDFAVTNQIELKDSTITDGAGNGTRPYLAALASYLPASVIFTFRILLSAVLTLFVANLLYGVLESRRPRNETSSLSE